MADNAKLTRAADNIRVLAASMVEKAKSGHPGGAMGGADFINVLYTEFLRYDPDDLRYPFRDRLFLDPGHMSPMLYSTLALAGNYTMDDLKAFRQWGSCTPGHPEVDVLRGVENTSGPLGQGHAMALGAAIAERFMVARFGQWQAHKTYAYISDGAVQEEISQGVGRIAGHLGLSNLIMYYDSNNIQLSTKVDEVDTEDVGAKYKAWGWNVLHVDGQSVDEIRAALRTAGAETERPTIIIGRTVMGKGAVAADGITSSIAGCFGCSPLTTFAQNIGLVAMTKVVNRRAIACGAGVLVLAGFIPVISAVFGSLPDAVLGGCTIMMFGNIILSGFQMIASAGFSQRNITIAAISLALGIGFTQVGEIFVYFPELLQNIFVGNSVALTFLSAVVLSFALPKDTTVEGPLVVDNGRNEGAGEFPETPPTNTDSKRN